MPILAPEPSMYPANLLDDFTGTDPDRRWWALYTKSRQEKSLARQLGGMSVPFYLPLIQKTSMIGGRRVKSQLPLFASYMFMFSTDEERVQALSTDRITMMLPAPDVADMTRDLQNIRSLIGSGVPLTVEARLQPGRRVRVKTGSLMGVEGVILSRRGEDRLLIGVNFLQQGVSVQIRDFQVEPL